jgi:ribose transport system ATP-binding protein
VGPGELTSAPPAPAPLLELRGASKAFGGVRALLDVDLTIARGEVHGLLGENGSGKSTLLKLLSGFHAPDAGELHVRGERVRLPLEPGRFHALGLEFVHQDLALVPAMSVTENLIASRLASGGRGMIRWSRERRRAAETLRRYGLEALDPAAPVARLTQMERALLAIVRAVEDLRDSHRDAPLLVLDEPTAFLPREGVEHLFLLIRALEAEEGASVLLVTHNLEEVREVCDRATILRDGRRVTTVRMAETSTDELVELIIGRRLAPRDAAAEAPTASDQVGARARGVAGRWIRGVDLELRRGEVLGVTGLLGSGFEELPHLLFGAAPGEGELLVAGAAVPLARLTPQRAMALGLALVPANRQLEAAILSLSVADNVTMTSLPRYGGRLRLVRGAMRRAAAELATRFQVEPNRPALPLAALSGGNQQKVVLAKWLQGAPPVLLLDQPTQGVDVGAREQIFRAIRASARAGAAVLCASADYEELAAVCDRLLVIASGRLAGELGREELTKQHIAERVLTSTSSGDVLPEEAVR